MGIMGALVGAFLFFSFVFSGIGMAIYAMYFRGKAVPGPEQD